MIVTVAGDEARFCEQLAGLLEKQGHRPSIVARPGQVIETLKSQGPHLLVTAFSSLEVVKQVMHSIRDLEDLRALPILCVNARGSSNDGVAVLDAGADDFIHRPFNPEIFLARVRTLLRRRIWSGAAPEELVTALRSGPLSIQLVSRQIVLDGELLQLTRLEFDLLAHLMKNPEKVLKRQELLEAVWNYPENVETRTLDKHVENVRRKLGGAGNVIETIHGVGYRFSQQAPSRTR